MKGILIEKDVNRNNFIKTEEVENDIAKLETVTTKEAAEILGLKYHTARNILLTDGTIRCIDYGRVRVWVKEDVYQYKRNHFVTE